MIFLFFFFFKQKTAYEMLRSLVGSEMCIRDSYIIDQVAELPILDIAPIVITQGEQVLTEARGRVLS